MGSTDMAATSTRHRRLLIDDVAEQYKHVESQNAIANSIEGRSGGMEDGCSWEDEEERNVLGARSVYLLLLLG